MSKPRVIKDYQKLSDEMKEQLKLVYPMGYSQHLISFMTKDGDTSLGLPFETEETLFLVRMTRTKAVQIVDEDEDFDLDGNLKPGKKAKYEDKYEDLDYLTELNDNEDNDLGNGEDPPDEDLEEDFD